MKKFMEPEVEIVELAVEDVITTSIEYGDNQTPFG